MIALILLLQTAASLYTVQNSILLGICLFASICGDCTSLQLHPSHSSDGGRPGASTAHRAVLHYLAGSACCHSPSPSWHFQLVRSCQSTMLQIIGSALRFWCAWYLILLVACSHQILCKVCNVFLAIAPLNTLRMRFAHVLIWLEALVNNFDLWALMLLDDNLQVLLYLA